MRWQGMLGAVLLTVIGGCSGESQPGGESTAAGSSGIGAGAPGSILEGGAGGRSGQTAPPNSGAAAGGGTGGEPAAPGNGGAAGDPVSVGGAGSDPEPGEAGAGGGPPGIEGPFRVMIYSETVGFRHDSIPAGIELITELGAEHDFSVDATEDSSNFNDAMLADYQAVVFLNASGGGLAEDERAAFQRYIQGGGGYVGVHCASCGAGDWPWYADLVGAVFTGHPQIQDLTVRFENKDHPANAGMPDDWQRREEPYNFGTNPRSEVTVLATFDESTYSGGTMGDDHPITWCHEFEGGRAWYTGLGHLIEGYQEELFIEMLLGGIEYAAGRR